MEGKVGERADQTGEASSGKRKNQTSAADTAFDSKKYRNLLAAKCPREITSDEQNEAYLQELEALSFAEDQTPEEKEYCKMLAAFIESWERRYRPERSLSPIDSLKVLMDNRGLKQSDLVPVIGSKSHISEILSGQRELSKAHIQKLSQFFRVSPEVFFPL